MRDNFSIKEINKKLFGLLTVSPSNLVEIVRLFSNKYPEDWEEIQRHFSEDFKKAPPKKSILYINDVLKKLEKSKLALHTGGENLFVLWSLGERAFSDDTQITIKVPSSLKRLYEQTANRLGTTLDEIIKVGLRFYMSQRLYQNFSPYDFLKVLIINNYGSSSFTLKEILPLIKEAGISTLVDMTLESYCREEFSEEDTFLEKIEEGIFKLRAKKN